MAPKKGNLYANAVMPVDGSEFSEILLHHDKYKLERIISKGQITPEGQWYDQDNDEWVVLLRGEARIEFAGSEIMYLTPGDYLWIPAHQLHRVLYTSSDPDCIWLALHSKQLQSEGK